MANLYIYPEYEYSFVGGDTLVQITLKPLVDGLQHLYNQVVNITLGPTDEPNDVFERPELGAIYHGNILGSTMLSDFNTGQGANYLSFMGVTIAGVGVFDTFRYAEDGLLGAFTVIEANKTEADNAIGSIEAALATHTTDEMAHPDIIDPIKADIETIFAILEANNLLGS